MPLAPPRRFEAFRKIDVIPLFLSTLVLMGPSVINLGSTRYAVVRQRRGVKLVCRTVLLFSPLFRKLFLEQERGTDQIGLFLVPSPTCYVGANVVCKRASCYSSFVSK